MIEPTPVSPISAPWESVVERLPGPRVGVNDALRRRLVDVCDEVRDDDESRAEAGRDWWPLAIGWAARGQVPARPALIARPTDTAQVSGVLAACNDAGVPVTPSAGRSGVCGSAVPLYGGVVLDLCGLAGIGNVDTTSLVADLRAGTFGPDVETGLRDDHDVTLGHWPQSMDLSTVGGWLACRGAGQYSNRYGKIEDMVIGLEVVLADGTVVRTGGRSPRSATGPDLNQLFVGSEGTLGVITEGRFRVHPLPTYSGQRAFGFRSFADGLDACRRILRRGATPAVLRLYDETESARSFDHGSTNVLIVLDEGDPGMVDATLAVVGQESAAADKLDAGLVDRWMEQRNDVSALAPLWRHGIVVDTVEISARWSVLPGLYRSVLDALHGVDGTIAASSHQSHAYTDGACLYFTFAGRPPDAVGGPGTAGATGPSGAPGAVRAAVPTGDGTSVPDLDGDAPVLDDEQQAWVERYYTRAWDEVTAATRDAGGSISHHHGIGINRARFLPDALGAGFGVLTTVKEALDPKGILNPGKLGLPNPFGPVAWP